MTRPPASDPTGDVLKPVTVHLRLDQIAALKREAVHLGITFAARLREVVDERAKQEGKAA